MGAERHILDRAAELGESEHREEQRAEHAADPVDGEDIERIVDMDPVLHQAYREITGRRRQQSEDDRGPRSDNPGRGRDRRQTGNGPGGEADRGRFAERDLFDRDPHQGGGGGGDVGIDDRGRGIVGRGEGGAAVETEPADPQHGRADHHQCRAMR